MGCASSKQKRCRRCNAPYSPVPRSYSMHVHHPPQGHGDSYHMVALTSTTLGSLKLDSSALNHQVSHRKVPPADKGELGFKFSNGRVSDSESFRFANGNFIQNQDKSEGLDISKGHREEFSMGLIEARTWSNMIEQKLPKFIPKTPIRTPPGEPETINTWELMEGLEDTSPLRSPNHLRSFSFDVNGGHVDPPPKENVPASPKPAWLHMTEEESNLKPAILDFDPEVISSFRKALQDLSPDSPFHLRAAPVFDDEKKASMARKGYSLEEKRKINHDVAMDFELHPCGKEQVVLYFTSLRGVRKTYEDCCQVRFILKGLGVRVDERDVSMHSGFKEELKELLGKGFGGGELLPKVFVGRNYIGGAEEIQKLHEDGKLENLFDRCEKVDDNCGGDGGRVCEVCGDIRFVPCETCSGSCKIYYEGHEEEDDDDGEVGEYGFQRCPDCNENGLIRCPICCY